MTPAGTREIFKSCFSLPRSGCVKPAGAGEIFRTHFSHAPTRQHEPRSGGGNLQNPISPCPAASKMLQIAFSNAANKIYFAINK